MGHRKSKIKQVQIDRGGGTGEGQRGEERNRQEGAREGQRGEERDRQEGARRDRGERRGIEKG